MDCCGIDTIAGAPASGGGGGGSGAPSDAAYILQMLNAALPNARVLTQGRSILITDFGPNAPITIDLSMPGAEFWTFANDGGPSDGIITTVDATPVFRTWGRLPVVGAAINFMGFFFGVSDDGNQCLFRQRQGGYARNAVGENTGTPVAAVVTSGFDELGSGLAPWNTFVAAPAGWAGGPDFLPGTFEIQTAFNGAVGRVINWVNLIAAWPINGATIEF